MSATTISNADSDARVGPRTAGTGNRKSLGGAVHGAAGAIALLTIATFWIATLVTELAGSWATVTTVKSLIPWGFLILVPALAATGASGMNLARGRSGGRIPVKRRRMALAAANGIVVLIPAAFFLASRAAAGQFDAAFYVVQAIELAAGAANIVLLGLNMRDGLAMTRRRRHRMS